MKIKIEILKQIYLDPLDDYIEYEGPFRRTFEFVLKELSNFRTREKAAAIAGNTNLLPHIEDGIFTTPRITRLYWVGNILWGDFVDPKINGWIHKISLAGSTEDVNKIYNGIREAITKGTAYSFFNLKKDALPELYKSPEIRIYTTDKDIDLKQFKSISQLEMFSDRKV